MRLGRPLPWHAAAATKRRPARRVSDKPESDSSLKWTFVAMGVLGALVLFLPAQLPSSAPVWRGLHDAARTLGDVRSLSGTSEFPFAAALSYGTALALAPLLAVVALLARRDREAFDARLAVRKPWKRALGLIFMLMVVVLLYGSEVLHPSSRSDGFDQLISQHRVGLLIYVELAVVLLNGVFVWLLHELSVLMRVFRRE